MKAPQYLSALPLALLCALPVNGLAQQQSLEERLDAQEARIKQLEAQRYQTQRGNLPVKVSGFVNAGAQSTNLGEDEASYLGADSEVRYTNFTSAGLQFDATLSDKVGGTVQLLSEGSEDFDTRVEWAYVSYNFTPSVKGRAGRLVAPFYMQSQYYYVGYAYPWVELPAEVYETAPVRTFEGVDFIWQFNTGDIAHALNLYHGSTTVESVLPITGTPLSVDLAFELHNLVGANLSSTLGNFTSWLAYSNADVDLVLPDLSGGGGPDLSPYSLENEDGYFGSVGVQYDNGSLSLMAEHIELGIHSDWFPTSEASYVMAGYRLGKWMPHVTWASVEDTSFTDINSDPLGTGLYNAIKQHQKSWTFGVRGDVATNLAIKAEVSRYYDLGNYDDGATGGTGLFSGTIPDDEDDPMVFRLAANLVF